MKIAHVFKDGDTVIIKAKTTKLNGDPLPQAGKRGVIIGTPKPGRHLIDVAGMPLINLPADDIELANPSAALAAPDGAAQGMPPAIVYAFDVLLLSAIVPSATNPRTHFEPVALKSLSDSIASDGLGQPILVRLLPDSRREQIFRTSELRPTYEIIAGERRYRACLMALVRSVPVLIRDMSDEQVLRMQLIENVQREDLHALEEAQGYRRILDIDSQADRPMSTRVEELAASVKKSSRYVYQTLQLLQLCDFARTIFLENKLQRTTALQVARIGNEAQQIEATRRIAGLAVAGKGTEVVNDPLSQRAAADYVQRNFMLVLSKAPFPVKVALGGAPACDACPKMSNNAKELFDESHKGPDTCMDPSCYGKKNVAHGNSLAEAARAKGQRVITGAEAKKMMPYAGSPDHLEGQFQALDKKTWDVEPSKQGQTLRQILGDDIPLPVLVADPHNGGFVEALPKADISRMLKERGLLASVSGREREKEEERKNRAETAYRLALAEQLLLKADDLDDVDLFESLIVPMAVQVYDRLDNDCCKRVHKLMRWEDKNFSLGLRTGRRAELVKHFTALSAVELNKFIIAASIASELRVAQYCNPGSDDLDAMSTILKVDAKAIKAKLAAEAKAGEKAKTGEKAKPAAPAVPAKKPASKKEKTPAEVQLDLIAPPAEAKPQPRKTLTLKKADPSSWPSSIGQQVMVLANVKPAQEKFSGMRGEVIQKVGDRAWIVKLKGGKNKPGGQVCFDATELEVLA